jgi:peptide/nickel transport system permease protein
VRRRFAARLGQSIVVTYVVATIAFFVIRLTPGEPFSYTARPMPPAILAQLRTEFGYDRPVIEQYGRYLANVAHGNFGWSFVKGDRVSTVIAQALPRTLLLAGTALALSFVLGVVLGVLQAARGGWFDRVTNGVLLLFYSLPDFWGALMILTVFTSWWRLLPSGGIVDPVMHEYYSTGRAFLDRLEHLVLPVLSLTVLSLAAVTRYQRAAMLDVMPSEFIRAVRAKGVPERALVWRHAFRNALTPMVTILGLMLPGFLGGAVFVERIFSWPGLGSLATGAIAAHDYDLVTATVVVGAVIVVVGNLLADLLHAAIDPRVRE